MKCYKVVIHTKDDRLFSAFANVLPQGWPVEYVIGQPVRAQMMGKLFAFTTLADARRFVRYHPIYFLNLEIYAATATNSIPINTILTIGAYEDDFEDFWAATSNLYDLDLPFASPPPNTIICDTITLIKRITQ